ncbi:MAG: protein translocase subunit SecD [Firmicutes bacterium]|jgi:preprotein translocase subunit SecD|nr:protein translocase subunit SecD [Bacillota bacterium]
MSGSIRVGLLVVLGCAVAAAYWVTANRLPVKSRARVHLAVVLVLGIVAGYYFTGVRPLVGMLPRGLDLAGGVHVVLEAVPTPEAPVTEQSMQGALEIVRRRVDALGVKEPYIQRSGNRIIIEIPGIEDPNEAIEVIGRTALLEFLDDQGRVIVTGKDLKKADVGARNDGKAVVLLEFNAEGARKFAEATARSVGKQIFILLDKTVISAPVVNEPIPSGEAEITGYDDIQDAYHLSVQLNSGALPVNLQVMENRSVSATLGTDSVARSWRAAGVGIAAVASYMLLYYRFPGLVADFALAVYLFLTVGALVLLKATLTLPGIAGIILSVGMAVDANVIIFERCKEELRAGHTLRSAIVSGFRNALTAIVDSNVTTLIAAGVLMYFGTGPIRGFAVTLSVGILSSMLTAIVFTRFLLVSVVNSGLHRGRTMFFGY